MSRTCSIEGCDGPFHCRGWCKRHYTKFKRHGDPLAGIDRSKDGHKSPSDLPDDIARLYSIELWSMIQIAEHFECSTCTVVKRLHALGVQIRPRHAGSPRYKTPVRHVIAIDELTRLYVDENKSAEEIGKIFGCSMPTILERLRENGIAVRQYGEHRKGRSPHNIKNPKLSDDHIVELYHSRADMSRKDVCVQANCTMRRLNAILKKMGVDFKSYAQVIGDKYAGPRSTLYNPQLSQFDRDKLRRCNFRTTRWRKAVFTRDGFSCLKCHDSRGGNLQSHHIASYDIHSDLRWDVANGATLCETCHTTFHKRFGFGNNTAAQFANYMSAERIAA